MIHLSEYFLHSEGVSFFLPLRKSPDVQRENRSERLTCSIGKSIRCWRRPGQRRGYITLQTACALPRSRRAGPVHRTFSGGRSAQVLLDREAQGRKLEQNHMPLSATRSRFLR